MEIEKCEGDLRKLADAFAAFATLLDGVGPRLSGGWYKLTQRSGSGYAWFRMIGARARKYPPNSLHLVVSPQGEWADDPRLGVGADWWGSEDRNVVAEVGDPVSVALAFEVLARAFAADASTE